ncbi:3-oxoacyl-reductase [Sparassis latifolia]
MFITGASSGIGLASAKLFFEKGWNVVATMRTPEKDTELKQLDSSRMLVLRLDVQDLDSIAPAVDAALAKFGTFDVLLNNAGYGQVGPFEMTPREKIQEQFDVNLFGLMDVTRAVLPHFRKHKKGGIINVSSGAGHSAPPMMSMYVASKFALEGFTEAVAFELASQGVFVKTVVPLDGIGATSFTARATASAALDAALMPDYGAFVDKSVEALGKLGAGNGIESKDIAQAIFEAATDGTDQLRYFVGDYERSLVKVRYGSNDQEYVAHVRSFFQ